MIVEITQIGNQKNKDKFNLFVDGEFFSGVLKETAIANNLFVGKKIERGQLEDIILQSEAKQAFSKASDYLAARLHSCREIYNKLLAKGYSKPAINMAIEKLKEYGYLDDWQFAKTFVQANNKLSKMQLAAKLASRGVSSQDANAALLSVDNSEQQQLAISLAQKFASSKSNDEGLHAKLYAHLARKGFDHYTITRAIKVATGKDIQD